MRKQSKRLILSITALLNITGCSTYPSKFKCGDARGLGCQMLATVDHQITTGEIEEVYVDKKLNCKGINCKQNSKTLPQLATGEVLAVRLEDPDKDDEVIMINDQINDHGDGKYLLIKE